MMFDSCELYRVLKKFNFETPSKSLPLIKDKKTDINLKSSKNESFLHLIAGLYEKDEDAPCLIPVVFQLSNAGIDVNGVNTDGNTALHIAATCKGGRKLVRALLMVGSDPAIENENDKTPIKIAKNLPDIADILNAFSPCLWRAVTKKNTSKVSNLLSNLCKIDEIRNGVTLLDHAHNIGIEMIEKQLRYRENTIKFAHYSFAGDRNAMRPYFKKQNVNINAMSTSFIDSTSGEHVSIPIVGEAALLGITSVLRKLLRKKVDINVNIKTTPLYLYIMQNIPPTTEFYNLLEVLLAKIDFAKKTDDINSVLDAAYAKKLPMALLRLMVGNGLDMFATDQNGHFLRDRILIRNIAETPKTIERELAYVDAIVVDMATNGCVDRLRSLVLQSYDHLDVSNLDGKSSREELTKSIGAVKADKFFTDMATVKKAHRECVRMIAIGHLAQVQTIVDVKVANVKDKQGRSLIHRAVLFERRHVLRHLIKICPGIATHADKDGRTPLHWACALDGGDDMQSALLALRCRMDTKDNFGYTPVDLGALPVKERHALLQNERSKDYGLDVYLYLKYLDIKEAIRAGDGAMVEEIRGGMYRDVATKDIMRLMYQTTPPQRCLLQFAMDARRDAIAKYLLTTGMEWNIKYKDGDEEMSLLESARKKEMTGVEGYILYQLKKVEHHKALIKNLRAKGVVKKVKIPDNNPDQSTEHTIEDTKGSKSCVIQ